MPCTATRAWRAIAFAISALLAGPAAAAEAFPQRPVSIVVPTTAGGTADILARLIGPKLAQKWGQPVVVENKPGAGTLVGSEYVARAQPDGHTLMLTFTELATLPAINKNARVDVVADYTRIGRIGSLPVLILAHPSMKPDTLQDLIAELRAHPGKYTYSSNGAGSVLQLYTEMFKREAGVDVLHIPYRGALEASTAMLAGEVNVLVQFGSGNVISYVTSNKAKAYAVASPERLAALPDVPTTAQAGLPNLRLEAWYGLFGPAGMDPALVERINADLRQALQEPDVLERFKGINLQPQPGSVTEFDTFFREEHRRWSELIQAAGIQSNQ
ncbi:tripartite tricarboxylate transporter substrate binding protein [Orrella sp. JC864]|uniref:tripartite tricarboxylate transporter substrate binding protein n=1 Tax=Orrella sp. JC864 TaxID=3120298 RepID=UPI0012BD4696